MNPTVDPVPDPVPSTTTRNDPMAVDSLTVFESMEYQPRTRMVQRMVIPPKREGVPPTPRAKLPSKAFLVKRFRERMRVNPRRPYTYAHPLTTPSCPDTFVITDPTIKKKGLFPRTSAYRYCVKELRNRKIVVFNIEWMPYVSGVKEEQTN